jgi:myo-inositol-1(or 4)-monophosphatase
MIDLNRASKAAIHAALLGRGVLLDYFGRLENISEKDQAGLVSEADVESERVITQYLLAEFPDIAIYGEESSHSRPDQSPGVEARRKGVWLIDPLDGTTNYIHKHPIFCVSIGLEYEGELVVGVVDVPTLKKTYSAVKGQGAFANGHAIHVSDRSSIRESLLATGFSAYDKTREQLETFGSLVHETRGIRRMGSAAYDMCLVAEGVFDAYWEKNLSPWDTAAGALLITEAGGVVTTFDTETYSPFDRTVIAGNRPIHAYVKQRIQKFRGM